MGYQAPYRHGTYFFPCWVPCSNWAQPNNSQGTRDTEYHGSREKTLFAHIFLIHVEALTQCAAVTNSDPGTLYLISPNRAVGTSRHPARQTQFGINVNPLESQSSHASPVLAGHEVP